MKAVYISIWSKLNTVSKRVYLASSPPCDSIGEASKYVPQHILDAETRSYVIKKVTLSADDLILLRGDKV